MEDDKLYVISAEDKHSIEYSKPIIRRNFETHLV